MDGHGGRLTRSNNNAYLVLCDCGWVTLAHHIPASPKQDGRGRMQHPSVAIEGAWREHDDHCRAVERASRPRSLDAL